LNRFALFTGEEFNTIFASAEKFLLNSVFPSSDFITVDLFGEAASPLFNSSFGICALFASSLNSSVVLFFRVRIEIDPFNII